ncbi:oil body-associated protein 1B-like [Teratosphaeria destructans]|uniref:Oil body-associated protein 1B-like n=1 Tax=Teratosphaeria destructans TaxID=418781 RepID=A0A9W7W6H4_9PEZI|nr:oil body-associated protein 1B-like [Teratosphaeria destructans]
MDSLPTTNHTKGDQESLKNKTLETGASMVQNFDPPKRLCAHLNAFHTYANEPGRFVEANHYCAHLNDDVRQCILYDSDKPNARLIGIEYMIKQHLYEKLDPGERKLWHSHVFEVKSGMLIMPAPQAVPDAAWETAECKEMEEVVVLYGKVYHLWQTDKGHELPLGEPQLMTSFTASDQFDFEATVGDRDRRFGVDSKKKAEKRAYIKEPEIHHDADYAWKQRIGAGEAQGLGHGSKHAS